MTDEDPNKVYSVQSVPKSVYERFIDMMFGQGFSTVLCCVVIYVLYNGMQTQIPTHLKTITDGYERISAEDRTARANDALKFNETHKALIETFKAEVERTERLLSNKVRAVETKIDSMNN